jgi:hypothetical protein
MRRLFLQRASSPGRTEATRYESVALAVTPQCVLVAVTSAARPRNGKSVHNMLMFRLQEAGSSAERKDWQGFRMCFKHDCFEGGERGKLSTIRGRLSCRVYRRGSDW